MFEFDWSIFLTVVSDFSQERQKGNLRQLSKKRDRFFTLKRLGNTVHEGYVWNCNAYFKIIFKGKWGVVSGPPLYLHKTFVPYYVGKWYFSPWLIPACSPPPPPWSMCWCCCCSPISEGPIAAMSWPESSMIWKGITDSLPYRIRIKEKYNYNLVPVRHGGAGNLLFPLFSSPLYPGVKVFLSFFLKKKKI